MTAIENDALAASPRLFESDILDKYSRVHHLTPPLVYGPIILWLLAYASNYASAGYILLAFLMGYLQPGRSPNISAIASCSTPCSRCPSGWGRASNSSSMACITSIRAIRCGS